MTHFLVLVVGDNVDSQLQPYHEYESTGTRDEHVKRISVFDRLKEQYETRHEEGQSLEDYAALHHALYLSKHVC